MRQVERLERKLVLALDTQRLAAGDQQFDLRDRRQQGWQAGRSQQHLLEVIKHDQHALFLNESLQQGQPRGRGRSILDTQCLAQRRQNQVGLLDGREVHKGNPVLKAGREAFGHVLGQAGFPHPRRADQGQDADIRRQ